MLAIRFLAEVEDFSFLLGLVSLSAIIPPPTPPTTGTKPKSERRLISEKISFEFKFFFLGKITLKSSSFAGDSGSLFVSISICFGDNSLALAVFKAFKTSLSET